MNFAGILITGLLLTGGGNGQEICQSFHKILVDEVTKAAQYSFSQNLLLDSSGFNVIREDEDWSPTGLFEARYGKSASTASFFAAILDFQFFEADNKSYTDITQLIEVGEHQDARKAFAAFVYNMINDMSDCFEKNRASEVEETIRTIFRSVYDSVGENNFASFLNLKLGSSLSFVMDTTGSMAGEIKAALTAVVDIIRSTQDTSSAPLHYVLVPFNDPGFGPVTKTSDPDEFINAVTILRAFGGGDIPELAMIGMLLATQNSGFRSIIYLFTDAPAGDYELQNHVIAACLIKKISVYVFLTKNIARKKRDLLEGRELYNNLAEQTGGLIMMVDKDDISKATEVMKSTTAQGLVMLKSISKTSATSLTVNVDAAVDFLIVQITGDFTFLGVKKDNVDVDQITLASIANVELFHLENVSSGVYTFNFDTAATNDYGVLIRGASTLGFHSNLSQKKRGTDVYVSSRQLQADKPTIADITVYGDAENTIFEKIQLVSRDGDVLFEENIERSSDREYKLYDDFKLPISPMVVKLIGTYKDMPIERIDPCAITPTVAESYIDDIQDITILSGGTIQVTTILHNQGGDDEFILEISDIRKFVTIVGIKTFTLDDSKTRIITLSINVPVGTQAGVLSKVLLTATGKTDNYFVFTTFVVSVIDDVIRCPTPISPSGGSLRCSPDTRSVGSKCNFQCGAEYVKEGTETITCQGDGTWDAQLGSCRLVGSQICSLGGDPHYTTFDNHRYDFMGSCLYTLVSTNASSDVEPVSISTENTLLYGKTSVSFFKQAFVTVYNTTIHFKNGKVILIDGIRTTLPAVLYGGNLQIKLDGGDVLLTTEFKLEVRYNGRFYFRVSLPANYINKVSGLCGNYDGNTENERMIGNMSLTPSDFGNHYEIIGGSNAWCRKGEPDDDKTGCENEAQRAIFAEKCSALKSDCFTGCADEDDIAQIFNSCLYDMCAFDGSETLVEQALADFAKTCAQQGTQICDWRDRFEYPKICGKNSHYELLANRCPNTCVNPLASTRCERMAKSEDCVCNDGFFRDGNECIALTECGCSNNGVYYKKGESYVTPDCTSRCECINGEIQCSEMNCDEGTECVLLTTGSYGCQVQSMGQCYATGDPHYKTIDGNYYNFMGKCAYVMLSTHSAMVSAQRQIKVIAQNENLNGQTRVSYLRFLTIEVSTYDIQLGPGKEITVTHKNVSGSELEMSFTGVFVDPEEIFRVEVVGQYATFSTVYGIKIRFSGRNMYIDVPSYYINKVEGLCGNYNGDKEDDFNKTSVLDFAAGHFVASESCAEDPDREIFVCSDEEKAKWAGPEYCGKLNDSNGPFKYCFDQLDVKSIFDSCVFDACATEGDQSVINEAIQVYGEACKDVDVDLPCNWEEELAINTECPENSQYQGCASKCDNTCQDPDGAAKCRDDEQVGRCVCNLGYSLQDGDCVKESTCGCVFQDGRYVEQGETNTADNCAYSEECTGAGAVELIKNPCSKDAKCKQSESGAYQCVPDELAYGLLYGGRHYKTFDNKFFTFEGNCGYMIAGYHHRAEMPLIPSHFIYLTHYDGVREVVVRIFRSVTDYHDIKISTDKIVTIDGLKYAPGSRVKEGILFIDQQLGNIVLNFAFGVQVHFNGKDWLRVDVELHFQGKMVGMTGNYNGDPADDFLIGDIMHTPLQWGDAWSRVNFNSDDCSRQTPEIETPCRFRSRYERSCDCGIITDKTGPFAVCHDKMNPEPFMQSCVKDACTYDGTTTALARILKSYYIACIGKGIKIGGWRDHMEIEELECPLNSHYSDCLQLCQPTCGVERDCVSSICQEGCQCDEGFILSGGLCVPREKCGCIMGGNYYEHGACHTDKNCTEKCTCVYGEWECEEISCYDNQFCGLFAGEEGCHWKDVCKYDNGGCSDGCSWKDDTIYCTCNPGRILSKDNKRCFDISTMFFSESIDECDTSFNVWKMEFTAWRDNYLPEWIGELEAYRKYVRTDILSSELACKYSWTRWFDRDDPEGCGDEETLEYLKLDYPGKICDKPIAAEGRMADGKKIGTKLADWEVNEYGLVCKNADQPEGSKCPDFAVRFLCPENMKKLGCS